LSNIIVRDAAAADCATLAAMAGALLIQHGIMVPDDLADALRRDGFGDEPRFEAMIAEHQGEPVGMTLYYPVYRPSLAGHGLLMEDLYVIPEARRLGVGRALMVRLARLAISRGCVYIEWLVESGNLPAETFYKATGATMDDDKMTCQIDGTALINLAGE
jgi:GNAT superfamily N-acetyltransferase